MAARTGQEYIERLEALSSTVLINGETVRGGIPSHPAFKNLVETYAELYDMQSDETLRDRMTYASPSSEQPVGMSFIVPRSVGDLERRRDMMKLWADRSLGTLGRTGDYLNCCLMALAEAGPWFEQAGPEFARNVRAYYEYVRDGDLLLTHTLISPQANRAQQAGEQRGGALTARIVREDDGGVVISGARMLATSGPVADELLVFPSTVLKGTREDAPYSFALAVPCDAPGLRFICRESFDVGRSRFDHPLTSRFEEMDAVVVFDDVHVPYERCFLLGHPEMCNTFYSETTAVAHMTHQVVTRAIAKTEATLGAASLLVDAIGIGEFQHVQEDLAELIVTLEIARGLMRAAEADAVESQFGVTTPRMETLNACRNWFPKASQRFGQILRKLGASGLMALPTEADIDGEARQDIETYLQCATLGGRDRVRLFRLIWDMSMSSFAGRQALYEYYFFGDPVRMAGALLRGYDRVPYTERVEAFLEEAAEPAGVSPNKRSDR
jgi:4-hydroxyphenylacetate 3-monooxygenase